MSASLLRRSLLVGGLVALGLFTTKQTYAQSGDVIPAEPTAPTGYGTMIVEQVSPGDILGTWTLLQPENGKTINAEKITSLGTLPAGNYTMIVEPPDGAVATLRLYNRGEEVKMVDRPQINFTMQDGDAFKLNINYRFVNIGTVSVQSDPNGMKFTMYGPNKFMQEGVTPGSFSNMAVGQYKVQFETLEGCVTPPPKALLLEKNKRVSFDVKIVCAAADKLRERQDTKDEKFVTPTIDGEEVTFRDVPQSEWFADAVFDAARKGILGGYKDKTGKLTGEFGPGNNVTVGELAKIAHRIAGLTEVGESKNPRNVAAQGEWFATVVASAEERGWTIYVDATIDPFRPATRGEVLVTLMQALSYPLQWQKGQTFTDVTTRTPYAAAIETAAEKKIVEGRKDTDGKLTGAFGPTDFVNRAEMAKIAVAVMENILPKK